VSSVPVLEVRDAVKSFGAVRALAGASLVLEQGEVLALLGDNGAGKSTLIKAIAGVHSLDSGELWFEGVPVSVKSPKAARALGIEMVYQDLALFDNLSAAQNFFAGRELRTPVWLGRLGFLRERKMLEETRAILTQLQVGIQDLRSGLAQMSGGQRQAIAVARAVAFASKVVILDEPTAALGLRESRRVLDLVRRLVDQGTAVILISHNLEEVTEIADRAVVLRAGRIVGEAAPTPENHSRLVSMIVGAAPTPAAHNAADLSSPRPPTGTS
jgi:D-xylose transport system ATP-binding protein